MKQILVAFSAIILASPALAGGAECPFFNEHGDSFVFVEGESPGHNVMFTKANKPSETCYLWVAPDAEDPLQLKCETFEMSAHYEGADIVSAGVIFREHCE